MVIVVGADRRKGGLGWQRKMNFNFFKVLPPKNVHFATKMKWQKFHNKILIFKGRPITSNITLLLLLRDIGTEMKLAKQKLLWFKYSTNTEYYLPNNSVSHCHKKKLKIFTLNVMFTVQYFLIAVLNTVSSGDLFHEVH
jgi:hypothetical protein